MKFQFLKKLYLHPWYISKNSYSEVQLWCISVKASLHLYQLAVSNPINAAKFSWPVGNRIDRFHCVRQCLIRCPDTEKRWKHDWCTEHIWWDWHDFNMVPGNAEQAVLTKYMTPQCSTSQRAITGSHNFLYRVYFEKSSQYSWWSRTDATRVLTGAWSYWKQWISV